MQPVVAGRGRSSSRSWVSSSRKPTRPSILIDSLLCFIRLILDHPQHFAAIRQVVRAGRKAVLLEDEREKRGHLFARQTLWIVLRHRRARPVEQLRDRQPVPVGRELAPDKRRRVAARPVWSVAFRAL